ncbi:MAG TPA: hypothetical protein ENK66_05610 [Arcobacter sp.]|jgi:hypothetical protein|nr:hypothetical protein [Arcobacter sp.]
MLKRNDSLPLYFDTVNGNTALGLYLENEKKPSIFYLEKTSDKTLRKFDPFMEEIGQIPIESKLVIESVETILQNQKSSNLEAFLERCKKRAISDRKKI